MSKILVMLLVHTVCCESYIYSSFWAPLFHRSILQYRVDVPFAPRVEVAARARHTDTYGYRGEKLIAALGRVMRPPHIKQEQIYSDIKVVNT